MGTAVQVRGRCPDEFEPTIFVSSPRAGTRPCRHQPPHPDSASFQLSWIEIPRALVDLRLEDPFRVRLGFRDGEAQPRDLPTVPGFYEHSPGAGGVVLLRRDAAE